MTMTARHLNPKQTTRKSQNKPSRNPKRVKTPCETNGKSKRLEIQITTVRRFPRGNDANRNPKRVNVQRTRRKSWLKSNRNPKRVNVQVTPQRSAMLSATDASDPPKAMYILMPSVWSSGKHCFQTQTKSTPWDHFLQGTGLTYHRKATARTITTPASSAEQKDIIPRSALTQSGQSYSESPKHSSQAMFAGTLWSFVDTQSQSTNWPLMSIPNSSREWPTITLTWRNLTHCEDHSSPSTHLRRQRLLGRFNTRSPIPSVTQPSNRT